MACIAQEWLAPNGLKPGDRIALVAPSGPADKEPVLKYAKLLEQAGFRVQVPDNIDRRSNYLAGTDQERLDELNAAIHDPQVRAIMPVRGGFGLTRILDRIDFQHLRTDPKIITGYSDLTALHLAISAQAKLVTFHSPMPLSSLWKDKEPEYQFANLLFQRMIFATKSNQERGYTLPLPASWKPQALVRGKASGRLLGGNLSLVVATLGTPYAIQARGSILFLEDVNESPYRIDRMLSSLRLAGVIDQTSGVILGSFSPKEEDRLETDRVLREYFGSIEKPVIWNYPVGHIASNSTLPHGALVEIDADLTSIRILEPTLRF